MPFVVLAERSRPVSHRISERWRQLVGEAVASLDTPCFVTDWRPVEQAVRQLEECVSGQVLVRSWLSFKTHPLPHLARAWTGSGRGVEVGSACELITLLQSDCPVDRLLVNGVAKHSWLLDQPIRNLRVHFDSLTELQALLPLAVEGAWRVGVRCHVPDEVDARAPGFGGQFGMSREEALAAICRIRRAGVRLESLHFHLGQGRRVAGSCLRALLYLKSIAVEAGVTPRFIDCGGGLPAPDDPACSELLDDLRLAISTAADLFEGLEEVWLENGRYITSGSTALAVRVLDVKERDECRYLICDGGRTNQALAADLEPHTVLPLSPTSQVTRLTTVCGPTCMTDDRLGRVELPDNLAPGEVLIYLDAGAYHLPWETRFSHGLCGVAWFGEDDRLVVARQREDPVATGKVWSAAGMS